MILGINFSKRNNGNCRSSLDYIAKVLEPTEVTIIDIPNLKITSCCDYDYDCFRTGICVVEDNMDSLIHMISSATKIIVALPVYRGHLCSEYFKIHERLCGIYRLDDEKYVSDYLAKCSYLLFVNRSAGYENAIDELNRDIQIYGGDSKVIPISSRDYDSSSIDGNLIDNLAYRMLLKELV